MSRASELLALAENATPGPWGWWCSKHQTYLATVDRGRVMVMTFVRAGMSGAQPCFQRDHRMVPALKIAEPDHNGAVDLHTHPDAAFIAACDPSTVLSLLSAVATLRRALQSDDCDCTVETTTPCGRCAALADTKEWDDE